MVACLLEKVPGMVWDWGRDLAVFKVRSKKCGNKER